MVFVLHSMQFVALLSGGKDSCFNILHCEQNGHELVAAATLGPPQGTGEIDSFMYQTVGQDAIELVAAALEVPLFRALITGGAVEQGADYGSREGSSSGMSARQGVEGDETEDLYALLSSVKNAYPNLKGVSAGAILSNYQRVRIEHVCRRLELTPLTYLWERDQVELLHEMIDCNMRCVLIKVAGIGLTPKHLGKSLAEMQGTLLKLHHLYGAHPCGEGGEYETLTLDCPRFRKAIVLDEVETVIHSDADFATVAYLRIKRASLQPKDVQDVVVPAPPLLSSLSSALSSFPVSRSLQPTSSPPANAEPPTADRNGPRSADRQHVFPPVSTLQVGSWLAVGNVQASVDGTEAVDRLPFDIEVRQTLQLLIDQLELKHFKLVDVAHINVYLSSMSLFADMNKVYSAFFGTGPPTRACVAVDLPAPVRIRIDCMACNLPDRSALHVQGLSYWAPANIGPYSQAVLAGERVFVSGQIGLVPPSMSMPDPRWLALEMALALQHVDRVVEAFQRNTGSWTGKPLGAICWTVHTSSLRNTAELWRQYNEQKGLDSPPTLFIAVAALPKDAEVEVQVLLHTNRFNQDAEEEDQVAHSSHRTWTVTSGGNDAGSEVSYRCLVSVDDTRSVLVFVRRGKSEGHVSLTTEVLSIIKTCISVRIFYVEEAKQRLETTVDTNGPATTFIPVRGIVDERGQGYELALMGLM